VIGDESEGCACGGSSYSLDWAIHLCVSDWSQDKETYEVRIYYYILAGVIVVGLVAFGYSSLSRSFTPYLETFAEVRTSDRPYVKVPGMVSGACKFDEKTKAFMFDLRDSKGDRMKVSYAGQKPFNFEQVKWVVVGGRYKNGVFNADDVSTKCPSKYSSRRGG